jgi:hypothetical protein
MRRRLSERVRHHGLYFDRQRGPELVSSKMPSLCQNSRAATGKSLFSDDHRPSSASAPNSCARVEYANLRVFRSKVTKPLRFKPR